MVILIQFIERTSLYTLHNFDNHLSPLEYTSLCVFCFALGSKPDYWWVWLLFCFFLLGNLIIRKLEAIVINMFSSQVIMGF